MAKIPLLNRRIQFKRATTGKRPSAGNTKILSRLGLVLFLAVFSALAFAGRNDLTHLARLREVKRTLIQENLTLIEENKQLTEKREQLKDPLALEKAARETLGLAKPDEIIYVVGQSKALPPSQSRQ